MLEEWRELPGAGGWYEVSSHGRVRSSHRRLAKIFSVSKATIGDVLLGKTWKTQAA